MFENSLDLRIIFRIISNRGILQEVGGNLNDVLGERMIMMSRGTIIRVASTVRKSETILLGHCLVSFFKFFFILF